jgi:16S rRNA (cytidine1402-2'-O)-methyltransferase
MKRAADATAPGPSPSAARTTGKLFLVATPIGNLGDITLRALEVMRSAAAILAEDTRRTRALLTHFGIKKPLVNYDAHAGPAAVEKLLARLLAGDDLALVTDAGTPGISDPGRSLVSAALERGIAVVPIPGVSAVTAAIPVSGLVDGPFVFLGFPARAGKKRAHALRRTVTSAEPVVLFESPHRMAQTLWDLAALAPERPAVLCRELTKLHEEVVRGSLRELADRETNFRGELTLVVAGAPEDAEDDPLHLDPEKLDAEIRDRLAAGQTTRDIVDALGTRAGGARRELYRRVTELDRALRHT